MKRRAWKLVAGLIGGVAVVVGAVVGDAHRRASAAFEHHEKVLATAVAVIRARYTTRPSAYPDPLNENGWDSYQQAFAALQAMTQDENEAIPEINGDPEEGFHPDDHLLHGIFTKYRPQMALLEKGARCRVIEPGYDYASGPEIPLGWLSSAIHASRFLRGAVAHHHRMGHGGEALHLAALHLAVAQDLPRKGPVVCSLVQFVCENHACETLREIFASGHSFNRDDLARFAARLDALEDLRPPFIDAWGAEKLSSGVLSSDPTGAS
jgi:hypothetical protein